MALWTPYAEDSALDLSVKCKDGGLSPYEDYPMTVPTYAPWHYVPVPQTSPVSSNSSFHPVSPGRGLISPPQSPISEDRRLEDTLSDDPDFQAFERDALRAMAEKNGGTLLGNNPRMRRVVQTNQTADDSYRKQRERNNFAAKQSRDRRKLREIHLALKVTYLKGELAKLKSQLATRACARCRQPCFC